MNSSIDYELYKVFYYVASYKSLTQAASRLGVSQPAVSQSLKQLESILGVKLTARTGHGIRLTAEGEILYPSIAKGCKAFEAASASLSSYLSGDTVPNVSDNLEDYMPVRDESITAKPAAKASKSGRKASKSVKVNDINASNIISPEPTQAAVQNEIPKAPTESQLYFVTGTQYRHFTGQKLPFRIIEHLSVVMPNYGDKIRTCVDAFLKGKGVKIYPTKEYNSYNDVIDGIIHNEGIGCMPESLILPYIESGKLFKLEFEDNFPTIQL